LKKNSEIGEDDEQRLEKEVQQHTDKFIKDIGSHMESKEKELMTV
jgi:ribosome recycling factor